MRGGERVLEPRHARTSLTGEPGSPQESGEICSDGFDTPVAQRALHARGRNWIEGRIAVCPRLQQIGQIT